MKLRTLTGLLLSLLSARLFLSLICNLFFSSNAQMERRVRRHFTVPNSVTVTSEVIYSAIIMKLPIGSSEQKIYASIAQTGLGQDRLSLCERLEQEKRILCSMRLDPEIINLDFARISYNIAFILTAEGRLKAVEVKERVAAL